ncbi:Endonuclease/exonuclease/phosphatase [Dichotomocladium elegans]|nr:Endonuclease/exonuclease/phosphatase [Dichotomocladium elegans]
MSGDSLEPSPVLTEQRDSSPLQHQQQELVRQESPAITPSESDQYDPEQVYERAPLVTRSYSQESTISTDSAPPPYEYYPPAKTIFGRAYNWLRQIPRIRRHQAIRLPTLPIHRSHHGSHTDSLSSASIDSIASSAYPATCCSYFLHAVSSNLPSTPRLVLPAGIARFRSFLICMSLAALVIFAFLLYCSIYFAPAALSAPVLPDQTTDTAARFLSLNVFMRPPGITNNWSDYKDERLDYIMRYVLPDYDVIAFQEIFGFGTRRKDKLIQQARMIGYNHHVESPRHYPWELGADGGLLILSRFPIRASNVIEFPRGIHSDWFSFKGAIHALIELNATRSVHLYTTHAQASYTAWATSSQGEVEVRLSQFSELHQLIRNTAEHDNVPMVLMGDFSVDSRVHDGRPLDEPSTSSSKEYSMMKKVLSGVGIDSAELDAKMRSRLFSDTWRIGDLTDALYDHYKYHPVTFGDVVSNSDGQLVPAETVLTEAEQLMTVQSLDYILWDQSRSSVVVRDARVQKFLVQNNDRLNDQEKKDLPFSQVSGNSSHLGTDIISSN